MTIDATSQTFTLQAAWEYVFGEIPTGFFGNVYIEFSGGNKAYGMVSKNTATFGSILGMMASGYSPYFYGKTGSTTVFKQIAMTT